MRLVGPSFREHMLSDRPFFLLLLAEALGPGFSFHAAA